MGDEAGWVRAVRCQRMGLGEPDASGRRKPVPIEGSEFDILEDITLVLANDIKASRLAGVTL